LIAKPTVASYEEKTFPALSGRLPPEELEERGPFDGE
jgi:hypothetical protein